MDERDKKPREDEPEVEAHKKPRASEDAESRDEEPDVEAHKKPR
jgi:hypothetical protein